MAGAMVSSPAPLLCTVLFMTIGCGNESRSQHKPAPPASTAEDATPLLADDAAATRPCGHTRELAPGLLWQTLVASRPPPIDVGDRCIRMLRIDPTRYQLEVLTATTHDGAHTAPEWARAHDLVAVINASMYLPNLRSTGLLVVGDHSNNGRDNAKFGAFMAFSPRSRGLPPVTIAGRGCPGFELASMRANYHSVVQNYRLFDCDGKAIAWQDDKLYSSAAIAIDDTGRVVFIHIRTPYRMSDVTAMLAAPELGLSAAMFVEGGPEASLAVHHGDFDRLLIGSYETGFHEHDGNNLPWPIPNVIGVRPR